VRSRQEREQTLKGEGVVRRKRQREGAIVRKAQWKRKGQGTVERKA
jgi:hypothetical protein